MPLQLVCHKRPEAPAPTQIMFTCRSAWDRTVQPSSGDGFVGIMNSAIFKEFKKNDVDEGGEKRQWLSA